MKITKEYLQDHRINPDYCVLHWLAGYELKDWLKLSSEEKWKHAKEWGRDKIKIGHGFIRAEENFRYGDLRDVQDAEDREIFQEKYR